jgi:hypothetical protein
MLYIAVLKLLFMEAPDEKSNPQPESVLDDVLDTREYDKKVKNAQNTIFAVAIIQFVVGLYMAFTGTEELRNIEIGIAVVISGLFFGLAFWCKSKPFTAIVMALSLYAGLLVLDAVFEPASLVKGAIVKIFIIIYLARGIGAAKAASDLKKMMGK